MKIIRHPRMAAGLCGAMIFLAPSLWSQEVGPTVELEAGRTVLANQVIVKWKKNALPAGGTSPQPKAAAARAKIAGVRATRSFSKFPELAVLELSASPAPKARSVSLAESPSQQLRGKMEQLMATGNFEYVVPDDVLSISALPADTAFTDGTLWGLRNTGQGGGVSGADIGAAGAWEKTIGSTNVVVAVIDTGIRTTHQDLAANIWRNPGESGEGRETNGKDDDIPPNGYVDDVFGINAINDTGDPTDDNGHGTHCAGTIGAVANGGGPHVGVAWNVKLMALKFLSSGGRGTTSGAIECINYALSKKANILSNSWGGGGFNQALYEAIQKAQAAGVLFVAAAGNDSEDSDRLPAYPASYDLDNIVSVAAINRQDDLAPFSNYGKQSVDVGAPGVEIYSCISATDGSYGNKSGTSMATPHVAGVAALILSAFPTISLPEWKARLIGTAVPTDALKGKCVSGGRVNAAAALAASPDGDGIMEASVRFSSVPLAGGETVDVSVFLSDLLPVKGATVVGFFDDGEPRFFSDNGISPDAVADDGIYSASLLVPASSASAVFTVRASAHGKQNLTQTENVEIVSRPANDDFAQQITLSPSQRFTVGSNLFATSQTGESLPYYGSGARTVWWRWTPASSGLATFSTRGSDFEPILAIYEGDRLENLQLLGATGSRNFPLTIQAEQGLVYRIQVDGFAGNSGRIVLSYPAASPPSLPPIILEEPQDRSVLLRGTVELSVFADGGESYQWRKDGQALPGATNATYQVDQATPNEQGYYQVEVTNPKGSTNSRQAYILVESVGLRPSNDDFSGARFLSGTGDRLVLSTVAASGQAGEPNHGGVSTNAEGLISSVWFVWSNSFSGNLDLDTFGSGFDTVLAAYRGAALENLTLIGANDDTNQVVQSRIRFGVEPGVSYRIAVAGKKGTEGNLVLNYNLTSSNLSPRNDAFTNRTVLEGVTGLISGRNTGATGEAGERVHVFKANPLASVWYQWVSPSNGLATFWTTNNNFDTVIAAYQGNTLPTAGSRSVAENDDESGQGSRISFFVQAGQTNLLVVDGFGAEQGDFRLRWTFSSFASSQPSILSSANLNAVVGREFRHKVRAEPSVARYFITGSIPTGLSFDSTSGLLSGIPVQKGIHKLAFAVEDDQQRRASQSVVLTIRDPQPRITSPSVVEAVAGEDFTYEITASGDTTRFDATRLPPGLTVDTTTGRITGRPTRSGVFTPVVTARNERGTARQTVRMTVTGVAARLTSDLGPVELLARQRYRYQVTCTGYVFEYRARGLPPGMKIDRRTGLISGSPRKAGRYEAVLQAVATGGTAEGRKVFVIR